MDDPRATCSHTGCGHCLHRRGFLKRCGAVLAAGLAGAAGAEEPKPQKARVGLVFLSNSQSREMWPYPNFDCEKRHQVLLGKLREGCPQVEFVPIVAKQPGDAKQAVALKDKVDGYVQYTGE